MPSKLRSFLHLLLVVLAVLLGAYLRFHNLRTSPAWYSDEGSNILISAALARGEMSYMAVGQSSFINGHPHLFYIILAAVFRLQGVDILWARLLSASLGLAGLLLIYPVSSRITDRRTALIATTLYSFYPGGVSFTRMAFTYSLLTPLYLIGLYSIYRWVEQRQTLWAIAAALCSGLALITDLAAIALLALLLLALVSKHPRQLLMAIPVTILPILCWGWWAWSRGGDAFLYDLRFTLSRTDAPLAVQLARIVVYYYNALSWDLWFALGSLGLLLLPSRASRGLVGGFFFGSLLIIMRTVNVGGPSYYFLIPYHPFICLGIATLVLKGLPLITETFESDLHSLLAPCIPKLRWRRVPVLLINSALLFVLLISPFLVGLYEATSLTSIPVARLASYGLLADPDTATRATAYINNHTSARDTVLAAPTIAWQIDAQVADFQMAVAAAGHDSYHLPGDVPPSRFLFNPRLENATYVILDPVWRGWASQTMTEVEEMVALVEEEWTLEQQFGEFEIYRNPNRVPDG